MFVVPLQRYNSSSQSITLLQKGDWELQLPGLEMRYYIQGEHAAMTGHFIRIDVSGTN